MHQAEKEIIKSKIRKLNENIEVWNNNKELLLKEFELYKGKETPLKSIPPSSITRYIDEMLQSHLLDFTAELNINSFDELEVLDSIYNQPYKDVLTKAVFILNDSIKKTGSNLKELNIQLERMDDSNTKNDGDDEITVRQFIENYFKENQIKIELMESKSQLERELHKKWIELYPEKPRKLSTFHRNLPRQ